MTVKEIAEGLVALCRTAGWAEAVQRYYSADIVSIEPMGENPVSKGLQAVEGKMEWWASNFEVHSVEVFGPFLHGDQFAVEFKLDTTNKANGERSTMDEIGVYTVKDGKIVEERFFFHA